MIEQAGASFWSRSTLHHALEEWLAALPADVVRARPKLCLLHAWLRLRLQDVDGAVSWVAAARQALGPAPAPARETGTAGGRWRGPRSPPLRPWWRRRAAGATGESIRWAEGAPRDLPAEDVGLRSAVSLCMGLAHLNLGDLRRAEPAFGATAADSRAAGSAHLALVAAAHLGGVQGVPAAGARPCAPAGRTLRLERRGAAGAFPGAGAVWVVLADLLREKNDLPGAAGAADRGAEILARWISPEMRAVSLLAQARTRQAQGDLEGALCVLDEARQEARHRAAAHLAGSLDAFGAQLRLAQGDLPGAVAWAEHAGWGVVPEPPEPPGPVLNVFPLLYACEHSRIAPAQALLARGWTARVPVPCAARRPCWSSSAERWRRVGRHRLHAKVLALAALTHGALREHAPAAAALHAAPTLG